MPDTPGTEQPESPVKGTEAGKVTEEPKTAPDEVATLRDELALLRTEHEEVKQQYESRIGGLVSANGDRQRASEDRVDSLATQLEDERKWREDVTRESLEPEQRAAYDANRSAREVETLTERLDKRDLEAAQRERAEAERAEVYNRAVQLGVPINEIDYRTVQAIEDSIKRWQETERNAGLDSLKSDLAKVQEELALTRTAAEDAARTGRGETAVPNVSAAPVVVADLGATDLPKEAQEMVTTLSNELNKSREKRDGGKILVLQRDLAERYGLEIEIERT